jgi:phosphoglycerate dehydrogenase-like enzyme
VTILVLIHSVFRMWTIPSGHVDRLRASFPQHTFLHAHGEDEAARLIGDADAAFSAQITPRLLDASRRLRWIHSPAAGIAGMLFPAMVDAPIVITNGRGISAATIAEHIIAVILALFRRIPTVVQRQQEKVWAQDEIGASPGSRTIAGSRVLIVGLGSIGAAAAVRLDALGASVFAVRRRLDAPPVPGVTSVHPPEDLLALLPEADVVVLTAPQTRVTRGLIGGEELQAMKPGAILVNVSRGGLVEEEALIAALRAGQIGGAALDVFRNEPLDDTSPLWDVPNLLITPHTAGFRLDHWDATIDLFADNLRRFERGEPLVNVVDKHAGY